MREQSRRYAQEGDQKPRQFKVGDMFVYKNGETAVVTEIFDRYGGKGKHGPEWSLRLMWTPGIAGGCHNAEAEGYGSIINDKWGVSRLNMFNRLSVHRGPHLYPVKEK
jgi:hypothetical protein